MKYVFFDIECANCFQGNGKICSFGYVVTDEKFKILEKKDIPMNPHSKFHLFGNKNHPGIVLAYDEKRCLYPIFIKDIKYFWGVSRVRAVVKGQSYLHLVIFVVVIDLATARYICCIARSKA